RDPTRTVLALPAKKVLFIGEGAVAGEDALAPDGVLNRLISDDCSASTYYSILKHANGYVAALTLTKLAGLHSDNGSAWTARMFGDAKITFVDNAVTVEKAGTTVHAVLCAEPSAAPLPDGLAVVRVDRSELERLLVRGARRALE